MLCMASVGDLGLVNVVRYAIVAVVVIFRLFLLISFGYGVSGVWDVSLIFCTKRLVFGVGVI